MLISQPVSVGGPLRRGHQPHLCRTDFPCHIAINDGRDLPRMSMEGLANDPGHSGEWLAVHGEDLVLRYHAGASGLGEWIHKKARAVRGTKRRPGALGVEKTVKVRGGAGGVEERRTNSQVASNRYGSLAGLVCSDQYSILTISVIWPGFSSTAIF